MKVEPYLSFEGRCDEAIEFYREAIGAEVNMLLRFSDCPEPQEESKIPPETAGKVMHSSLRIGESTINATDGRCSGTPSFSGISLSLHAKDEAEAERLFSALADGGQVQQPLIKTFFSPSFGMVADRFGVAWMVYVPTAG